MLNSMDVLVLLFFTVVLIYGIARKWSVWKIGEAEERSGDRSRRFAMVLSSVVGHDRILEEGNPGIMHLFIFFGFLVPFLFVVFAQAFFFTLPPLAAGLVSFILDVVGVLALVGLALAVYRRYGARPERLDDRGGEDVLLLCWLAFIFVSGFVVEGLRLSVIDPDGTVFAPVGSVLARGFAPFGAAIDAAAIRWVWRIHFYAVIALIGTLPYTKLLHLVTGTLNAYYRSLLPKGVVSALDIENAESFGVAHVHQFTWKQLMDSDACIRCGRCQDNCPAFLSEKPLSPKKLVQDIRSCLYDKVKTIKHLQAQGEDLSYGIPDDEKPLIGGYLTEDEIWACTTCRACMEVCPMYVEQIDKVVDLRRNLVLMESSFPAEVQTVFKNMENNSNPWGIGWADRANWCKDLEIKTLAEDNEVEILLWIGCAGSFDDRYKRVARSFVKILQRAGISFGILGTEEKCCGDSARKMGNEYLFQMMAMENIEVMNGYGVKKIVVMCPHGYNTIKKDYQQFGGHYEVLHHTEYLHQLLQEGRLPLTHALPARVTYHDSCYLGRYNEIFSQPRAILSDIPGLQLVEMDRRLKRGYCCGAGGGRMWMEETIGKRINEERVSQALEKNPQIAVTACPFCMVMFEDGLKTYDREADVKVYDIIEMVEKALG
ncbi:MAG: 4Fe-4S dicluster domain-containing protein [Deltaproteobacteria bacterium]|nr:4Fe-4S dicluster domain-containing protein [Candidatus Anaeroferrophillus wilburensis]MBN2888341.1 4Fe-4S dicluster domain-containing protein [Deltaproteobacteria bacterium]